MPQWSAPQGPETVATNLAPFVDYLRTVRGNSARTIRRALAQLAGFERYRKSCGRHGLPIRLSEVDRYVISCRRQFSRSTTALICSTIRAYLRFLYVTGKVDVDLSLSVIAPIARQMERPYPILPWGDVQRILRAVDRTSSKGRRDYAILVMMVAYGLGAAEVVRIRLDDIDWRACTIRILRRKTGAEYLLPLLPAVARAIFDYLKHGRPAHTPNREIFVATRSPFGRFSGGAVRDILQAAAHRAGVSAPCLGTHVLRHTHATRQLELSTPFKLIGDILGHRDPDSTSVYTRVPSERLRDISLPVPT